MITEVKILKNLPAAIAKQRELVVKYENHAIFKAFETFLYLKQLTTSGKVQNVYGTTDAFMLNLSEECNVSRNTMYNRIKLLQKYQMLTVCKLGNITLTSWEEIAKRYNIKDKEFHTITLTNESPKIEYILRALTLSEHKERMSYKFAKFINSNNQLKEYLLKSFGTLPNNITQLAEWILKKQVDSFRCWSEGFDFWHSLRADFNASVNTLMQYFGFCDFRQVAYWKKQLSSNGLILVEERKHDSKKCKRTATNVFTGKKVLQTMFWDNINKARVWHQPDAITVIL